LVSNGGGPGTYVDPVVSQGTDSNLNASVSIKGSSNAISGVGTFAVVPASGTFQANLINSTVGVTGTFWQATQPVSAVNQFTVTPGTGTFPISGSISSSDGGNVTVTGTSVTQPVSEINQFT